MSEELLVAVPSEAPGGIDAAPSAHFGHCAAYTVARFQGGDLVEVNVTPNAGHEHGNCIAPVQALAANGVKVLIAGGMGVRPLQAMRQAGMQIYHASGYPSVGDVLRAFAEGALLPFAEDSLCKGGCGHH